MGQPRKHTRREESPCFENTGQAWLLHKNSSDPGWEIAGDHRCGGIRVSQALEGQSDTNKHNMPLQTHHRGPNCPQIWRRREGRTTGLSKSDIKALLFSDCVKQWNWQNSSVPKLCPFSLFTQKKSLCGVNKKPNATGSFQTCVSMSFRLFVCIWDTMCVLIACFAGDSLCQFVSVSLFVCVDNWPVVGRSKNCFRFPSVLLVLTNYTTVKASFQGGIGVHIYSIVSTNSLI